MAIILTGYSVFSEFFLFLRGVRVVLHFNTSQKITHLKIKCKSFQHVNKNNSCYDRLPKPPPSLPPSPSKQIPEYGPW